MPRPHSNQKKILVVDDEPSVYGTIKILLEHDGHEVVIANNGNDALALLDQNRFDLVITDYTMPGMKGDELARSLKTRLPSLPVIMITAHIEMLKSNAEALANVDHLIGKPFDLTDLRDAIQKVTTR